MNRLFLKFAVFLLLPIYPSAGFTFPVDNPVPGGIALIAIPTKDQAPKVYYKKKQIAVITENNKTYALVGISLSTRAGKQQVKIIWPDGRKQQQTFSVKAKTYKAQYLTIKNKRKVDPNKDDMKRIKKERKKKNSAKTHWSDKQVNADFIIPVQGRTSSIFGLRRFFNKQARRPHSGLDIAAAEGTPIKAVESGTIIEAGNFFFSGNMVYVDHGQGIISLYAHMSRIDVKPGDIVSKGQVIGAVGETGRVTGPHLHLAVIANQTLVDPLLFLPEIDNKTNKK